MCPLLQASTTACVSMIAPRALFTIRTPFLSLEILSLSNSPLSQKLKMLITCMLINIIILCIVKHASGSNIRILSSLNSLSHCNLILSNMPLWVTILIIHKVWTHLNTRISRQAWHHPKTTEILNLTADNYLHIKENLRKNRIRISLEPRHSIISYSDKLKRLALALVPCFFC